MTIQVFQDSLGRVACLPSIPVASIVFGFLSLVKSLYDLNIYPLVHSLPASPALRRLTIATSLCRSLMPCFVTTAIFRIAVLRSVADKLLFLFQKHFQISFMFVYLDNWSIIPIVVIWLVNLTLFSVQARSETSKVT